MTYLWSCYQGQRHCTENQHHNCSRIRRQNLGMPWILWVDIFGTLLSQAKVQRIPFHTLGTILLVLWSFCSILLGRVYKGNEMNLNRLCPGSTKN